MTHDELLVWAGIVIGIIVSTLVLVIAELADRFIK